MKIGDSLNINLLPSQAKFQADQIKLKKMIRRYESYALSLLLVIIIVTAGLFLGSGFVLRAEQKKYQKSVTNFESMSEEIVLNQLLKYRAKVLGQVLKDRFEYAAAFEKVTSLFSEKAEIKTFKLDEKDKVFEMVLGIQSKEGVDYIENRVVEINEGKVEGVKGAIIKRANYSFKDGWSIDLNVGI